MGAFWWSVVQRRDTDKTLVAELFPVNVGYRTSPFVKDEMDRCYYYYYYSQSVVVAAAAFGNTVADAGTD